VTQTVLHFVFTLSGAGCLVQALRQAGRDDQVVVTSNDMEFGPINPGDLESRAKWVESELGPSDWNRISLRSDRVWDEARFPDHRKVVWLTRRSAMEFAGFLDWLWVRDDVPCDVVDLSEIKIPYRPEHGPRQPRLAISLGMLHPDIIRGDKLWDLAEPLQMAERRRHRELWDKLRSENAMLCISDGDKLVSVPISFFDPVLMSYVTDNWQKVSRVVGPAMASQMSDDIVQTGDMFLSARVNALAESGNLEIRGKSALEMFSTEVRLPGAR
jgi:hypothetical protein